MSDTEEVVTPGVVIKDYAWYELREIVKNLRELSARAVSLGENIKTREHERNDYFHYLETKIEELKAEVESLRSNNG